jgi:hypothetical protein
MVFLHTIELMAVCVAVGGAGFDHQPGPQPDTRTSINMF